MRRLWLLPPVLALAGLSVYIMVLSKEVQELAARTRAQEIILAQSGIAIPEEPKCSTRQFSYSLIDADALLASVKASKTDLALQEGEFIGACESNGVTYQLFDRTGLEFASEETLGDSWAIAMSGADGWEIINFTPSDTSFDGPQCYFSGIIPAIEDTTERIQIDCESTVGGATLGTGLVSESFMLLPESKSIELWYSCTETPKVVTMPGSNGVKQINDVLCTSVYEQVPTATDIISE